MADLIFSEEIVTLARREAIAMSESGEKIRKFNFGRGRSGGGLWLASDETLVIGGKKIEVEGKAFYIALFRKEE
jgi:hypothetical protein